MTNTISSANKRNTSNGFFIFCIAILLIVGFSALLHVAYQHGDGTVYGTGYEMGAMLANITSSGAFKNGIGLGSIIAVLNHACHRTLAVFVITKFQCGKVTFS